MSKLSKREAKAHRAACELLEKDVLTLDDKWFVIENWQESANHVNSEAGAFFTPPGLANDFSIEIGDCRRVIDLCAGIGGLSFAYLTGRFFESGQPDVVCVERNPEYIKVGKKLLPNATWVEADVFDLVGLDLGHFDVAISNPPFGSTARCGRKATRFSGASFEYHIIDLASDIADYGVFIIPQMSAPFKYSGARYYEETRPDKYLEFHKQTSIALTAGCGIDTSLFRNDWHGTSPATEVVCADFKEARQLRAGTDVVAASDVPGELVQQDLFLSMEAA